MDQQILDRSPVASRFANVDPENFEDELDRRWEAIEAIKQSLTPSVVAQVKKGAITPAEGIALYSCVAGQLLGHAQFHGTAGGADMVAALSSKLGERELADSRS